MAAQFGYEERMFRILVRLKDEFGVTNLQTFMCGGIAAQFGEEERMFRALVRLKDEFGVTNLQTFMCNTHTSIRSQYKDENRRRMVEQWNQGSGS